MRIARVTGRVTASVKASGLSGQKMLLADIIDINGGILEASMVLVDACGAGPGDLVLVATGSGARVHSAAAGIPTDATAVAFIDEISAFGRAVDLDQIAIGTGESR
ncbi:MAG: EutN/CcmL family microcompartment protein [Rhodobacteraceae bacterium]|nr:EutN/CcmL family microcompartment protein [Paracoccaceae bacterium]